MTESPQSAATRAVAERWFTALTGGDFATALDCLADDVEWINYAPVPGYNDDMAWIGTVHDKQGVLDSLGVFTGVCEVGKEELVKIAVDGENAVGVIHEESVVKATGLPFEIEFIQWLTVREGKVVRWKSYTDPSEIIRAIRGDDDPRSRHTSRPLLDAVQAKDTALVTLLLAQGADPNTRDEDTGLTALLSAAGQADPATVRVLLSAGADPLTADSRAGATALHKACQGGSLEVAKALVEAGAFVDAVAPTTGHTPLMDALWYKYPDLVEYLLAQGAGLEVFTHYGFSLKQHFEYELNVNTRGKDLLLRAEQHLNDRRAADGAAVEAQRLMAAVAAGDTERVPALLAAGAAVDAVFPRLNGFNDGHIPLHVAARDGHTEIVRLLLEAGSDVNAVEPCFGASPLHKAVYNGHAEITALLVARPGINLDFQGATNGYTPLHDAIWHGYEECVRILLDAGARTDLVGHDGKTPLDLAAEVFGAEHELTRRLNVTAQ
ncbi:ankyrin repeat domain-containing protein [Kitasatospora sp. NBC_01287]|uniref:ankyrin repeat domain-containing protein n=1 Tax=Kitasatospora sp. NBC_01287 TaxID=2903573 RepID=UPI00224D9375|nr:ankyrin repeat domain-containing protein [Kitasatospora sp. NBC_01287]MCX4748313.1 ankyrin repeat domain-containing protein [Kitasatospora sp. NBC_01287]